MCMCMSVFTGELTSPAVNVPPYGQFLNTLREILTIEQVIVALHTVL